MDLKEEQSASSSSGTQRIPIPSAQASGDRLQWTLKKSELVSKSGRKNREKHSKNLDVRTFPNQHRNVVYLRTRLRVGHDQRWSELFLRKNTQDVLNILIGSLLEKRADGEPVILHDGGTIGALDQNCASEKIAANVMKSSSNSKNRKRHCRSEDIELHMWS